MGDRLVTRADLEQRFPEDLFRLLFERNPQPMWVYDLETLAFLAVNEAAIVRYGYSREEFLAMTIEDIRPLEDVPEIVRLCSDLREGGLAPLGTGGKGRHRRKDGTLIDVEVAWSRLTFQDRDAVLVLVSDVTEQKREHEELREGRR